MKQQKVINTEHETLSFFEAYCDFRLKPIKLKETKNAKFIEQINEITFNVNQNHANRIRYSSRFVSIGNNFFAPSKWWNGQDKLIVDDRFIINPDENIKNDAAEEAANRLGTGTVVNKFNHSRLKQLKNFTTGLSAELHFKQLIDNQNISVKLTPNYDRANNPLNVYCFYDGIFTLLGNTIKIDIKCVNPDYSAVYIPTDQINKTVDFYVSADNVDSVFTYRFIDCKKVPTKEEYYVNFGRGGYGIPLKLFLPIEYLIGRMNTAEMMSNFNLVKSKIVNILENGEEQQ